MCDSHGQDNGSIYLPEVSTLVTIKTMTDVDSFFEFTFDKKDLGHKPGQFAEVSIPASARRRFSISSSPLKKAALKWSSGK